MGNKQNSGKRWKAKRRKQKLQNLQDISRRRWTSNQISTRELNDIIAHELDVEETNQYTILNNVMTIETSSQENLSSLEIEEDKKTDNHKLDNEYNDLINYEFHTEIEQNVMEEKVQGRRIVDIAYLNKKLKEISGHGSLFNCGLHTMTLVGEKRIGLRSKFKYKCDLCNSEFIINSESPENSEYVDANVAATAAIISSGIGYSQFEEIISSLEVPNLSNRCFSKIQNNIFDKWEESAVEEMEAAAKRERDAAIAEGRLKNGIPIIDVYADGCWSARSYGNNYKALSGAAVIIGRRFGEVLFMAVKNKYCIICARAQKKKLTPKQHSCYKNYTGSSTGMEADIICEGFTQSMAMYNLIYGRLVADGDSVTYCKILASNPYPNHTVEKIECRNHILRNMCKKMRETMKNTKYPLASRKLLTDQKIMSMRKVIVSSIKQHEHLKSTTPAQAIQNLYCDIQNSILHAFGDHRYCLDYYCSKEKVLLNSMEITNSTLWFRLRVIIGSVASKSRSLVENVDTNSAERFNSIIAKMVGGKRINFSLKRSYQGRCAAAVVSYNNDFPLRTLHKKICGQSPKITSRIRTMERRRLLKRQLNKKSNRKKNRVIKRFETAAQQNNYGENCAAPDLSKEELEKATEDFLNNLKDLTADKDHIQKTTILQRDCSDWLELRKYMLTASNFGAVIKRRANISSAPLVKNILYKKNISHVAAVAHGLEHEQLALQQLSKQENVVIEPCGLFVDSTYPFIGATPDGIIGLDTIVEVKCPVVAFKNGIESSIKDNKVQMWKYNKHSGTCSINKKSNWFYQIQGQLHVTQKKKCLFAVWGGENIKLKTEYIERDDNFWTVEMEKKLVSFYLNCIVPELVDPRHTRGLPLRDAHQVLKEDEKTVESDSSDKIRSAPVCRWLSFSQL